MYITIASGKGGTGKTTLATSLVRSLTQHGTLAYPPIFLDCDVEAPNAHLFLKPTVESYQDVAILIPHINHETCTHCGKCAEVCMFHAIAVMGTQTLVFPEICHGCGSCTFMCPQGAITEQPSIIGTVQQGHTDDGIHVGQGTLTIGQSMTVPIIRQLKRWLTPRDNQVVVLDAPPGTSCPVVETIRGSDVVLLVTEPTPFGLHDLQLAVQVTRELAIPAAVIINRYQENSTYRKVEEYCEAAELPILMRIPFEREVAAAIARGIPLTDIRPAYNDAFLALYDYALAQTAAHNTQNGANT